MSPRLAPVRGPDRFGEFRRVGRTLVEDLTEIACIASFLGAIFVVAFAATGRGL